MESFPLLSLFIFAPALGMLAVLCVPSQRGDIIKTIAAAAAAVPLFIGLGIAATFQDTGDVRFYENVPWIPTLGAAYKLGVDGLTAPLLALSGVLGFVAAVASWGVESRPKAYFALLLLVLTGVNGLFCALDLLLFFACWQAALVPLFFLLILWSRAERPRAAMRFVLLAAMGSALMLVAIVATWNASDGSRADATRTLEARRAIYDRHLQILKDVEAAEVQERALTKTYDVTLSDARIAAFFRQRQIDPPADVTPRNHVERLRAIQQSEPSTFEQYRDALATFPMDRTFDLEQLKERNSLFLGEVSIFGGSVSLAMLAFGLFATAFAFLMPLFPFHTWLPGAAVETPAPVTLLLAGLVVKMGVVGFLRVAIPLYPTAALAFATPLAILGVVTFIYGIVCALGQADLRKIAAYVAVSQGGFTLFGLAALTPWSLSGALAHTATQGGTIALLLLLVGALADRAGTGEIRRFGGLAARAPRLAGIFAFAGFAVIGLPGLATFASEVLVFLGAFQSDVGSRSSVAVSFASMSLVVAFGAVLTAASVLWTLQRVFLGPLNEESEVRSDLHGREIFSAVPLALLILALGVCPQPLVNLSRTSVERLQEHVVRANGMISTEIRAIGRGGEATDGMR